MSTLALGMWYGAVRRPAPQTVVRVGIDDSPPFYTFGPDGKVSGLAVEVLNEAARRKNIRLEWHPSMDVPLDQMLGSRRVQMWPLVGATPERQKQFYMTAPWLESDYVLLSLEGHRIRTAAEAAGETMAHARLRMTAIVAQKFLPHSQLLVKLRRADAIQAVCSGEARGAVVEGRVLDSLLLSRPPGCESARFNISALTGATTPLSIIAVPELKEAADELRSGISELVADGYLARKLDEWSPFSAEGARSIWAQQEANARNQIYRRVLALIFFLAIGLGWLAWRAFRLRQTAEAAQTSLREAQRRFSAFMDNSPALSFMKDAHGRLLYFNRAWSRVVGHNPEDSLGKDDFELFPAETARELRSVDLQLLEENRPRQLIEQIPVAGETRDFLVVKFPFAGETGERFIGGTAIDITHRQSAVRDLAASEARYRELFEHNPLPAWVVDRSSLAFLTVNAATIKRYGWTREEFLGGMALPDVLAAAESGIDRSDFAMLDSAHEASGAWWHQTREGIRLSVEVTSYEMEYEHRPARLMIVRDLTQQERTLEQLRVSEERWQLALHGTGDALWDWDLRSGRVFRSPRWSAMLGYGAYEIGDSREDFTSLLHPDDVGRVEEALNEYLGRKTDTFSMEYRLRRKDGAYRWILDRGRAIWDERDQPLRMAGSQTDVTERKEAEERLEQEAHTDALTSLPNRREFDRVIALEFQLARESGVPLSVCVCDLDRFKDVNDTWGHATGDRVLITFAGTLRENLRSTDVVGRIGGDEFILAMPGTTASQAADIVNRIRHRFSEHEFLDETQRAGRGTFRVTCSFGIAELHPGHQNAAELVASADQRLYAAKQGGRNKTLVAA